MYSNIPSNKQYATILNGRDGFSTTNDNNNNNNANSYKIYDVTNNTFYGNKGVLNQYLNYTSGSLIGILEKQ